MKASGAAGPMEAARVPGNAKMLPPIVRLTMDAASAQKPMARIRTESLERAMAPESVT